MEREEVPPQSIYAEPKIAMRMLVGRSQLNLRRFGFGSNTRNWISQLAFSSGRVAIGSVPFSWETTKQGVDLGHLVADVGATTDAFVDIGCPLGI